jgi:hypothetical protein
MAIAILSAAQFDDDRDWSESLCLHFLGHHSYEVKIAALMGLSHIARLHGTLDLDVVIPMLAELKKDATLAGRVSDTLDDIRIFVTGKHSSPHEAE